MARRSAWILASRDPFDVSLSFKFVVVEFSGVGSSSPNGESSRKNSEPSAEFIHSRYDKLHYSLGRGYGTVLVYKILSSFFRLYSRPI